MSKMLTPGLGEKVPHTLAGHRLNLPALFEVIFLALQIGVAGIGFVG